MAPRPLDGVRVLVLSDTHLTASTLDRMPAEVWALAERADVVLHAGDVVDRTVLDALAEHAPVLAVLGNNDRGMRAELPEVVEATLGGVPLAMVHDSGERAGRAARMSRRFPAAAVVVFGHSHDPMVERPPEGPLLVNPGSPTQRRRQRVHTVGTLELAAGQVREARLVEVGPLAGPR
ncbi:MAG: metallophosphoesterase family protein [Acidimicrobiales bacterium]|nr:metallophosphoesterase family protein [Acidimicrobiales bacterium]